MTNWKNLEGASIADNPCWGGPEPHHHDLQYLLRVLGGDVNDGGDNITERSTTTADASSYSAALMDRVIARLVIYNDDNYIAIHKPADLRMDGPHLATVHKLLLYLYPPPSMIIMHKATMDQDTATANELVHQRSHEHLIKSITPLTNTSDLKDDIFRTVHQLDYATSGVLLMAKNRKAAGTACISFQERKAKKTYVAVVTTASANISNRNDDSTTDNSLPFGPEFFDSIPKLPKSSLQPWAAGTLEQKYRKKRRRDTDGKDTFNGYMPEHSIFAKWRGSIIKKRKEEKMTSAEGEGGGEGKPPAPQQQKKKDWKKKKQNNNDDSAMVSQLIQSTTQHLTSQNIDELLSIGPSWKKVKAHCESSTNDNIFRWPSTVEQMTKKYNQMTTAAAATTAVATAETDEMPSKKSESNEDNINATMKDESASSSLPPLFCIEGEDDANNSFYICASIGEVGDGRFDVLVDPSLALPETQPSVPTVLPEMKPSLTKCTVLWRGYVKDTIKGSAEEGEQQQQQQQQQQLRVPVAKVLLSPWTGRRHQLRVHLSRIAGCPILGDVTYTKGSDDRGVIGSRMCLHAKELSIPLIGGVVKTFTAQDPFVIKDGDSIQIDNFC